MVKWFFKCICYLVYCFYDVYCVNWLLFIYVNRQFKCKKRKSRNKKFLIRTVANKKGRESRLKCFLFQSVEIVKLWPLTKIKGDKNESFFKE